MAHSRDIPPRNEVELTRERLVYVLEYLSTLIPAYFSRPLRLVTHGGACMLLHPGLHKLAQHQANLTPNTPPRHTTRDVDYINRSFATELLQLGVPDASQKLQLCIRQTATALKLGADWMNSDADIALPMATAPNGKQYDPIYDASIQKNNVELHTIFTSKNRMLTLVSVAPFWAVALKLVRYTKWDPGDICLLLKYGTVLSGTQWSADMLERWLTTFCWTMNYANYDSQRRADMHKRINHAIQMVNMWGSQPGSDPDHADAGHSLKKRPSADTAMGAGGLDKTQAEWGGGDRNGWEATFVWNWNKTNSPPRQIHHQKQLTGHPPPPPQPANPATHAHPISHSAIPPPPHITSPPPQHVTSPPPPSMHSHQRSISHQQSMSHLSPPPPPNTSTRRNPNDLLSLPQNIAEWSVERHRSRSRGKNHSPHPSPSGHRRDPSREPEIYVPPMDSDYENSDHVYGYAYDEKYYEHQGHLSVPTPPKTRHRSSHSHSFGYNTTNTAQAAAVHSPPPYPGSYHAEDFDRQLGSLLYQSSRAAVHHPSHTHHRAWRGEVPDPKQKPKTKTVESRKKKKKRDRARDRARDTKWSSRLGSGLFGFGGGATGGATTRGRLEVESDGTSESDGDESESDCESSSESEDGREVRPVIPGTPYQHQHQHQHQHQQPQGIYASPPPALVLCGQAAAPTWLSPSSLSHSQQPQPPQSHSGGHRHGRGTTGFTTTAPTPASAGITAAAATGMTAVGVVTSPPPLPPPPTTMTNPVGVVPQQFRHMVHPLQVPQKTSGMQEVSATSIQPHMNSLGLY